MLLKTNADARFSPLACMGSENRSTPDLSRDPNIRRPTTTIRLALYMSHPAAIIDHHVTLLLMGKDSFEVDINLVFDR